MFTSIAGYPEALGIRSGNWPVVLASAVLLLLGIGRTRHDLPTQLSAFAPTHHADRQRKTEHSLTPKGEPFPQSMTAATSTRVLLA